MTPPIADRFIDAQTWWIASEIVRRHAGWSVIETFDEKVGSALTLVDLTDLDRVQLRFTRAYGLQIMLRADFTLSWQQVFSASNPHRVVKMIEDELGIGSPDRAPATNATNIRFRAIARILALTVDDRSVWTVRGERPDDPTVTTSLEWAGDLGAFPSVPALQTYWREELEFGSLYLGGASAAWVLLRDLQPVALFDQYGDVHTERGRFALLEAYRMNGGGLTAAIVEGMGHLLP